MKILLICDMFPSKQNVASGSFIAGQARELGKFHEIFIVVIGRQFFAFGIRTVIKSAWKNVSVKYFGKSRRQEKVEASLAKLSERDGSRLLRINYPVLILFGRPLHFFNRISSLLTVLLALSRRRLSPDLIHAHKSFPSGYVASRLKAIYRVPFVITEHQCPFLSYFVEPYRGEAVLNALRTADKTICVSRYQRDTVARYGIPLSKLSLVYNGVDVSEFRILPERLASRLEAIKDGRVKLLLVGTLEKRKGITFLLEALDSVRETFPDVSLSLVGAEADESMDIFRMIKHRNLIGIVSYLGVVPNESLPELINEHDILVCASTDETFGVAIVEAMACGKPVVATKCGGPEETVTEKTGMLVEKANAVALGAGIKHVIEHYEDYSPEEIREHVVKNFSQQIVVARLNNLFCEILEGK